MCAALSSHSSHRHAAVPSAIYYSLVSSRPTDLRARIKVVRTLNDLDIKEIVTTATAVVRKRTSIAETNTRTSILMAEKKSGVQNLVDPAQAALERVELVRAESNYSVSERRSAMAGINRSGSSRRRHEAFLVVHCIYLAGWKIILDDNRIPCTRPQEMAVRANSLGDVY